MPQSWCQLCATTRSSGMMSMSEPCGVAPHRPPSVATKSSPVRPRPCAANAAVNESKETRPAAAAAH
eukprot:586085-Prymnesium_polylepis.1